MENCFSLLFLKIIENIEKIASLHFMQSWKIMLKNNNVDASRTA